MIPSYDSYALAGRPAAKSSKIIQNQPIDFFGTLWYSVLSTQEDRVLREEASDGTE